jgi:class 3 adenylate cyclase/tetratricopeptide (TPR) repeat protein
VAFHGIVPGAERNGASGLPDDIQQWLADHGLGEHAPAFVENRIDFDVLAELTEAELRELGLPLGDRKRLLRAIAGLAPAARAATDDRTVAEGERRHVTVLFADISGFTALAADRDAEETHALLNRFFTAVDGVVRDYGGAIDKHMGDAVMAVFGAPIAHSDDPERAVRAALQIHPAAAGLDPTLRVHIGVASGQVVASSTGSADHREYTMIGDTVNLASRLTDLATAGQTLVCRAVQAAIGPRLEAEGMGEHLLHGLPAPTEVWRVTGIAAPADAAPRPLVGRRRELAQFKAAIADTLASGEGQSVLVRGEAGIGKTRLVEEFQQLALAQGFRAHTGLVLDFGVGKGQDAIRALVRSLLDVPFGAGIEDRASAAARAERENLIAAGQRPYLDDLLDLPLAEEQRRLYEAMDNADRNRGKAATLAILVAGLATETPLLLRIEDIHWADRLLPPQLAELARQVASCRALLVLTSRIQGDPLDEAWRGGLAGAPFTTIDLGPLNADEANDLVTGFGGVDDVLVRACIERSGGNPLFLEQLLHGAESAVDGAIPGSIQSVVQARIDGLAATDRAALQAAAVLGQRFALPPLRRLIDDDSYTPDGLLHNALIRPAGDDFLFAHALIRDAVHDAFLTGRRRELHLRAADWYRERDAVLFAEHLAGADDERAPGAFLEASRREVEASRLDRALGLVERGRDLARSSAERHDLTAQQAALLQDLGRPAEALVAWREALELTDEPLPRCRAWIGIAAADRLMGAGEQGLGVLDEADTVARDNGFEREMGEVAYYRGAAAFVSGDMAASLEHQNKALVHARRAGDAELEATALGGLADAEYARGRMAASLNHFQRCLELCREHGLLQIEVRNRFMLGTVGRYVHDQALGLAETRACREMAERIHHHRAVLFASLISGEITMELADHAGAEEPLERTVEIARSLGNRRIEMYGLYEQARNAWCRQRPDLARDLLRQALAIGRETGMHFHGPRLLGLAAVLAEGEADRRGALAEGEALIRDGVNAHNVLWFHRDAIDACLTAGAFADVRHHAGALDAFVADEPLPWAGFFADRGRVLAASAEAARDEATGAELGRVLAEGRRLGLAIALPPLERALAATE